MSSRLSDPQRLVSTRMSAERAQARAEGLHQGGSATLAGRR